MSNKPAKSKEKKRDAASRNTKNGHEEIESKETPRKAIKKFESEETSCSLCKRREFVSVLRIYYLTRDLVLRAVGSYVKRG